MALKNQDWRSFTSEDYKPLPTIENVSEDDSGLCEGVSKMGIEDIFMKDSDEDFRLQERCNGQSPVH